MKTRVVGLIIFSFLSCVSSAEIFEQKWEPIPDAKLYEIEVSQEANFQDDAIIRQEETKNTTY